MSASTAPAAVPDPQNTPASTPPAPSATGLLGDLLAPVAPARTAAFTLDPQAAVGIPAASAVLPAEGVSSDAYHGDDVAKQGTSGAAAGGGAGKKQQGIWRAWMLAGAARWARGGGTQNKRLDVKKARAMANQVKESRTVNSGPAGGGGRSSNASGAGAGKSLGSKSAKGGGSADSGSAKGPKNTSGSGGSGGPGTKGPSGKDSNRTAGSGTGTGPKQGSGGGGRGPSGGTSPAPKGDGSSVKGGTDNPSRTPKPSKDTTTGGSKTPTGGTSGGGTPAGGKSGSQGAAGPSGKPGTSSTEKASKPDTPTAPKGAKPPAGKGDSTDTAAGKPSAGSTEKTATPKPTTPAKGGEGSKDAKAASGGDKPGTSTTEKGDGQTKPTTPGTPTPAGGKGGKPFTTRSSRETGYRDGTRAAQATAHVKAYKDGVKDGYTDTAEAAAREKAHLDQAHTDRKNNRTEEQPVTNTKNSADYHQAQPITVQGINSTHVLLGNGADKGSVTRGEVRSLKGFERRMETKADAMGKAAEGTKALKAHADQQAKQAMQLLEAAKGVKGGEKLTGTLTKLQEAAQVQADKADEIHTRALRAAEAARVVLTNAATRYGPIYQAVVDSDETTPAELAFYKG